MTVLFSNAVKPATLYFLLYSYNTVNAFILIELIMLHHIFLHVVQIDENKHDMFILIKGCLWLTGQL